MILKMGEIQESSEPEFVDEIDSEVSSENPQGRPSAGEWEHDVVAGTFVSLLIRKIKQD